MIPGALGNKTIFFSILYYHRFSVRILLGFSPSFYFFVFDFFEFELLCFFFSVFVFEIKSYRSQPGLTVILLSQSPYAGITGINQSLHFDFLILCGDRNCLDS